MFAFSTERPTLPADLVATLRPVALAKSRTLPLGEPWNDLVPGGGLRRGTTVVVQAPPPPASAPPAPAPAAPPMAAKPAPAASRIVVPAGTKISVRTVDLIDSKTSRLGQEFRATLATAVKVKGHEAFRVSDKARLRLEETASSGHSGKPELILELVSIATGGRTYIVSSAPFLIKARFLRKKRVAPGTLIEFTLNAPVTLGAPPS